MEYWQEENGRHDILMYVIPNIFKGCGKPTISLHRFGMIPEVVE